MKEDNYKRLLLSLGISFCIMYVVMFLNVDDISHVYLSLTRLYMSLLMVTPMALLMLAMMRHMYNNRQLNRIIAVTAVIVFAVSLWMLRTQTFISDRQYMKAMIPHHSSAILTSKHAHITDPDVKKLSERIIQSQEREINEMKSMLDSTAN